MAGAKPRFTSAGVMQELIDKYFTDCDGQILRDDDGKPVLDKWGRPVIVGDHPPTVTGLALALGFQSRQSLINYQGKKQFVDTITRAKMRVEEYAERRLYDRDGARGAEFTLRCNFRWAREERADDGDGSGVVLLPPAMDVLPAADAPGEESGGDE